MIENHTKEEMSLSKQRETRRPVTASSSRTTTGGSVKSRRSVTEKRSSVGDKLPRGSHKEDKDSINTKPISVSVPKDEKKEEEKQVKDKVESGIKQRFVCTRSRLLILYPFIGKSCHGQI